MNIDDLLEYISAHKIAKKSLMVKHFKTAMEDGTLEKLTKRAVGQRLIKPVKNGYRLAKDGRQYILNSRKAAKAARRNKLEKESSLTIGEAKDDALYVIKKHEIPNIFPEDVVKEAELIPEDLENLSVEGREDIRDEFVVTIDGDDAKDFDDAINVSKTENGYRLGVHIADVSHFVRKHSALDKEASKRGNSVYLIDTVVPMFPFRISNGTCSLKEGVTRFTMSIFIDLNNEGEVISFRFAETVIRSKGRLTYRYVQDVLDGKAEASDELKKMLADSNNLMGLLKDRRVNEGSIEFDLDEIKISLNEEGLPVDIRPYKRVRSHKIIEEFMLLANRCVAEHLSEVAGAIYRVHDMPNEEKLANFERIAFNRGYKLPRDKDGDIDYKEFFSMIEGKPDQKLLSTLLLRSMKQAYYTTNNIGHYGLAFAYYTHFTSPIRRYPDLEVHRVLRKILREQKAEGAKQLKDLSLIADKCSKSERVAVEAERELAKIKGARFLEGKVGQEFDGVISGVTSFGMFVEITEYGVEGLIRYQDMKGYFSYDEADHTVTGSGKTRYVLGDKVRVMVHRVNVKRSFVDLLLL